MPSTYRERLRIEGLTLALIGVLGSVLILKTKPEVHLGLTSTVVELVIVLLIFLWFAPRSVHRSIAGARRTFSMDLGTGEPKPLWRPPLVIFVLTMIVSRFGGWDAGLVVTIGCVLIGLAEAGMLARIVALNERSTRRIYFRVPGSRFLRPSPLGYIDD